MTAIDALQPALVAVPEWPLENPVLVFTIAVAVFLIGPLVVKRLRQPGIVGIVLLGAILGPGGTNLVAHSDAIVLLGNVGLIYLLFTVGVELDLRRFLEAPEDAALFGVASFGIPFVIGAAAVAWAFGLSVWAAALLAAVFASHTLLAYPVVNQYNITQNRAVTAVFGGILFTDTLALLVLAFVRSAVDGGGLTAGAAVSKVVTLLVLVGGIWLVVPRIARGFFQNFSEESYFEFLFVLLVLFVAASMAELLEIAPILGAFVGGLALNRLVPEAGTLMRRIEFVGNALFIPFFLLHVGMLVDFGVLLSGSRTLIVAATIIGVMVATKWVAAWLVAHVQDYSRSERGVIFGLSIGQAAAALAITIIGYELALFDATILNAVVVMLLVTAVVSPWVTKRAGNRLALDQAVEPDTDVTTAPSILLPVTHAGERQRNLMEFAFLLREPTDEEPIHLLTVIRSDGTTDPTARVEDVQADLDELAKLGSEAEVPVETEVRVSLNPASGIVTAGVETQADVVLLGWSPTDRPRMWMFGDLIDQVLGRTDLPVIVASLDQPVATSDEFLIVLPAGIDHHEGFFESVYYLKKLASDLGVSPTVLAVGGSEHQYERLFGLVEPELTAEFRTVASWADLRETIREEAGPNDLVTVLSSRRGDVGWHEALGDLPSELYDLPPESFILVHPRKADPEYDRLFLRYR